MDKIFLRKKIATRIADGHNWVFQNEIGDVVGEVSVGAEVSVFSYTGSFVGKGWYAGAVSIAVRMLSRDMHAKLDEDFVFSAIKDAFFSRRNLPIPTDFHRVFNAESDGISGLNIDKWQSFYVVQCLTQAVDMRYEWIVHALMQMGVAKENIVKDDSSKLRKYEQLPISDIPELPRKVNIKIGNTSFAVKNISAYSLDRSLLQQFVARVAQERVVWDLCCGNGNLGKVAVDNGAHSVLFLDNDPLWKQHYDEKVMCAVSTFKGENVFDFLKSKQGAKPQLIILDPPVFTVHAEKPLQAYRELVMGALRHLGQDGLLLVTNSSSKILDADFVAMLASILADPKLSFRIIDSLGQSPDFGKHPLYPHLDYLSGWVLQKREL